MSKVIRVTQIEKYRRYRDGVSESYDTEQSVIDSLSGAFTGNELTTIGTAGHLVIENGSYGIYTTPKQIFKQFGVVFTEEQTLTMFIHARHLTPTVPEIRLNKTFVTPKHTIIVSGQMDVLQGTVIRDNKFKFSPPKLMEYFNSYQWRIYLSIFGLDRFIYDIFEFSGHDERDVSKYTLTPHEPFECLRYKAMEQDIESLIGEFCDWMDFRDLWHYLPDNNLKF